LPIDQDFENHKAAMGGYDADDAYKSKTEFFKKYFFGYQTGRLQYYDEFMRKYLRKEEDVLSIGSGRCANELYMMEDGYKITCSDLGLIDCHSQTKALFPEFNFLEFNILNGPNEHKYDTIICLSLIYLFDDKSLMTFFKNVSGSLKKGGHLILDSAGAPDNFLSYLIHDVILKYEIHFLRIAKMIVRNKKDAVIRKHHGYRRTDNEIIESAWEAGLKLVDKEEYAFLTEFRRSILFNRLFSNKLSPPFERMLTRVGKKIPYIRMFYFEKATS
jgi:2-polyprenyl-3-methyl-5-hydroxy-6-metoxy-1,4-benzoquinol methylase